MVDTDVRSCACGRCSNDAALRTCHGRWLNMMSILNERQTRLYAAERALEMGWGGINTMAQISGLSERTIRRGMQELQAGLLKSGERARAPGGGRNRSEANDPGLLKALETLMGETSAGDPMSLLKWTTKSTRVLAEELDRLGHAASHMTVYRLLQELDYSLRGNSKSLEGKQHPNRDAQFRYINREVKRCLRAKIPVISVDTKKKEKVGLFDKKGKRWRRQTPAVNTYDFPSLAEGQAIPYGVYDMAHNEGMVNVGMSHDTAEFAVESIERWWRMLGRGWFPRAQRLLITADGGGSNGSRNRLWKYSIQQFADRHGLDVTVCHYPPGTSKWNKVEHRLFSFISISWRGEPLTTYETVIDFITSTSTKGGLQVKAQLDHYEYETRKKITDEQMETLRLRPHKTHPKWNYTINQHKRHPPMV
jgi:hypothetical protein